MDQRTFDYLARLAVAEAGTRRTLVRVLASGALGVLVARVGLAEDTAANPKRQRRADQRAEGALQAEGKRQKKSMKKRKKRCSDLAPLCTNCAEPRCNTATGEWVCRSRCRVGWSCCNELCEPPCNNGCVEDPSQACICLKPPTEEDVYCELEHLCGANPCPPGKEYDSRTCTCRDSCPDPCPPGWERASNSCQCGCANGGVPLPGGGCCPPRFPWIAENRVCWNNAGEWTCPSVHHVVGDGPMCWPDWVPWP